MQRVSVLIVSYNVRYFLRQCIQSILKSRTSAELEIIVVDNNSSDGSVEMLKSEFPSVLLIANESNRGFSKANNQALSVAKGNYVLVLNPDTIIREDTLQICLDYFQMHPGTGALGVRMFDGAGKYLPESKRGLPTPLGSLFKITGLSKLFRHSAFFNSYYMGHLDPDSTQEIEVLSGAFIFSSRVTLESIGGFDEDYFMYGEDIELSTRIREQGKKLIYLPSTSIVHFKGESTNKNTLDYLRRFYGAMQIYSGKRRQYSAGIWKFILNAGIFVAGLAAFFKSILHFLLWPAINVISLYALAKGLQYMWARFYYQDPGYYSGSKSGISILVLCVLLVLSYYIFGHFDKVFRKKQWNYAAVISALMVLAIYGLFPLEWRFSRTILVFLVLISPFIMYLLRVVYNGFNSGSYSFGMNANKRVLIVGNKKSADSVLPILLQYYPGAKAHIMAIENAPEQGKLWEEIQKAATAYSIHELIFCSRDLPNSVIFRLMAQLGKNGISFKIANNDNTGFLGSSSRDNLGQWYTLDIGFKLSEQFHRRSKRILDIIFSFLFLLLSPIILLIARRRTELYSSLPAVFFGNKTWISYDFSDDKAGELPSLKRGVWAVTKFSAVSDIHTVNIDYARNYSLWSEIEMLFRSVLMS